MFSFKSFQRLLGFFFFFFKNNSEESLMLGKWSLKGAEEWSQRHF